MPGINNSAKPTQSLPPWQQKLKSQLIRQLTRPELNQVINVFFRNIKENCPDQGCDPESIADYLLTNQGDGDSRRFPILWFLDAVQQFIKDEYLLESLRDLLAYLLQTLVCKCEENNKGLTTVPVKYRPTVELIDATKKTAATIPSYGYENLEFKNTRRNHRFMDMGDFQPPSGVWEPEPVCREMAKKLLKDIWKEPDGTSVDEFNRLDALLSRHDFNPGRSPLQGISIHLEKLEQHPLNASGIAEMFRERTGNRVPIYVFGEKQKANQEATEAHEWLHVAEERIRALVVEDNPIVKTSDIGEQKVESQNSQPSSVQAVLPSVFISYSSKDLDVVESLDKRLRENGLRVIIDYRDLKPGQKIDDFIGESVKASDATICVVSRQSLLSGWVSKEATSTFHLQQWILTKKFIACFLEDCFFEPGFRLELTKEINNKIKKIEQLIPEYNKEKIDTDDLNTEKSRLYDLRNNLGKILQTLKDTLSMDIREPMFDTSINSIVKNLKAE